MQAEITRFALDRVPLSLIIDDSTLLYNLNYFWMRDRNLVDGQDRRWQDVPMVHPQAFTAEFATWCLENGVRGKFSVVPVPAGIGRIDKPLPLFTPGQQADWLRMCRELITPSFDITPEMLTHTRVLDPDTLQPLAGEPWEQYEWETLPEQNADLVYRIMRLACQILCDVGLPPQGVTSPGGFAGNSLPVYALLTGAVLSKVTGNACPYFFKRIEDGTAIETPVWYADAESGTAVGEIIAATQDHTGSWEGYRQADADYYIREDGSGGRLVELIRLRQPAIMCSHWQGFYGLHDGDRRGFRVLQQVVERLRTHDPDGSRTLWQKPSQITRYACARSMANLESVEGQVRLNLPMGAENLTLAAETPCPATVCFDGKPLEQAASRAAFGAHGWFWEGGLLLAAVNATAGNHVFEWDNGLLRW